MPFLGNIGPGELILILVIALIIFGPGKLPEIGQAVGKGIREFRKAATDVTDATRIEATQPPATPAATPPAATPPAATPTVAAPPASTPPASASSDAGAGAPEGDSSQPSA